MASFEFWGGLGVIGSSKIMVTEGGHVYRFNLTQDVPGT